jgi:hypothetical protein
MTTEKPISFHAAAIETAKSNNWDYAFALGYVSGKFDKADGRSPEHRTSEYDDYALGYHRGYSFSCPKGYGECEDNRACQYPGRCNR